MTDMPTVPADDVDIVGNIKEAKSNDSGREIFSLALFNSYTRISLRLKERKFPLLTEE